jgi:DNA-binding transcriptional ArsR family regulator
MRKCLSFSALAAVFAALGDPVRLRVLSMVAAQGEVCSCHLQAPLGVLGHRDPRPFGNPAGLATGALFNVVLEKGRVTTPRVPSPATLRVEPA